MPAIGNFVMGDFFGDVKCRFGQAAETAVWRQGWRQENEGFWRKNSDSVKGYKYIELD